MGIQLANAERLALEAIANAWQPPPAIDYLAFAERNITITEGGFTGPYNRRTFPYLDAILTALGPDDPCRIVTFQASAQSSKTTVATIFAVRSMAIGAGTMMAIHPTTDNAARWSKIKLQQMMRSTAAVAEAFPQRSRDASDSILFKQRADGLFTLIISGANSPATLSQVTAHRQIQDDLASLK